MRYGSADWAQWNMLYWPSETAWKGISKEKPSGTDRASCTAPDQLPRCTRTWARPARAALARSVSPAFSASPMASVKNCSARSKNTVWDSAEPPSITAWQKCSPIIRLAYPAHTCDSATAGELSKVPPSMVESKRAMASSAVHRAFWAWSHTPLTSSGRRSPRPSGTETPQVPGLPEGSSSRTATPPSTPRLLSQVARASL